MEATTIVKNGMLRLPPGFRFHPTDEELVLQYLRRKVFSCPLPASIIPEVEVCKSDPWDLPGDSEHERYYFSTKEVKYPNGSRSNRATASGYWKATGADKQIVTSRSRQLQVVGMKKTLVFYRGKPPNGIRTDWIMHEYRLANNFETSLPKKLTQENWVLCRIFLKKRSSNGNINEGHEEEKCETKKFNGTKGKIVFYDFMGKDMADLNVTPRSSSSGTSGITEISSESDEHREESSCNSASATPFKRKSWP